MKHRYSKNIAVQVPVQLHAYQVHQICTGYILYGLEKLGMPWVRGGYSMGTVGQKQNFWNFSRAPEQLFFVHFEKLNNFRVFCNNKEDKQIRFTNIFVFVPFLRHMVMMVIDLDSLEERHWRLNSRSTTMAHVGDVARMFRNGHINQFAPYPRSSGARTLVRRNIDL